MAWIASVLFQYAGSRLALSILKLMDTQKLFMYVLYALIFVISNFWAANTMIMAP
jgi:hypothetical protein